MRAAKLKSGQVGGTLQVGVHFQDPQLEARQVTASGTTVYGNHAIVLCQTRRGRIEASAVFGAEVRCVRPG